MSYRITLKPSGHSYEAEETKSVLQAGLDAGHMLPYSCRAGVCRTCRGTILEGKVDFPCTAWAIPNYSLFGWQRPCYLMSDGYVPTYRELIEDTDWDKYGRGKDPRCANCMAHCGYEPTAVLATMGSLKESLRAMRETVNGNRE